MGRWTKVLLWIAAVLAILGGVAYAGYYYTHDVPSGRILYKRWKAPHEFVFDKISPHLLKTDPAALIQVEGAKGLQDMRARLADAIWGDEPDARGRQPDLVEELPIPFGMHSLGDVARVERLKASFEFGYDAYVYVFYPKGWTGQAAFYHHGYAGNIDQAQSQIATLLAQGRAVAAFHFMGYGEGILDLVDHPQFGMINLDYDRILQFGKNPLRYYVEPVVVTLNHLEKQHGVAGADMMGFSAGGWVTTLAASVDPRIRHSVAVASLYPIYLRDRLSASEMTPPHLYTPLLQAANYLEMAVSAASGAGRSYTQVFNRYDRCCYRNRKGELYAPAVSEKVSQIGDGRFQVLIDETHADHKVSEWTMDHIRRIFSNGS